jgi:hypothetical protein
MSRSRSRSDFGMCRDCQAPVRWVTMRESGKRCPVNIDPDPEQGVIVVVGLSAVRIDDARAESVRSNGGKLYTSHFATCAGAEARRHQVKVERMGDREFLESLGITVEKL